MLGPNETLIFMTTVALVTFVTLKTKPHQVAEPVKASK